MQACENGRGDLSQAQMPESSLLATLPSWNGFADLPASLSLAPGTPGLKQHQTLMEKLYSHTSLCELQYNSCLQGNLYFRVYKKQCRRPRVQFSQGHKTKILGQEAT